MVALAIVERYPGLGVPAGSAEIACEGERTPPEMMRLDQNPRIVQLLGKVEDPAGLLARGPQVAGDHLILAFAAQGDEQAARVALLFGNRCRPGECLGHVGIAEASRGHEAYAQRVLECDLPTTALRSLGHGLEQVQSLIEVPFRLEVGRSLHGALSRLQPLVSCGPGKPCLGVVVSHHLGLVVRDDRELLYENLRDAGVLPLPVALEERLIGHVLD